MYLTNTARRGFYAVLIWSTAWISSLHKDVASRATYSTLLEHRFLVHHQQIDTDISEFVASVLDAAGGSGGGGDAGGNPGGASGGKMDTVDSANGL